MARQIFCDSIPSKAQPRSGDVYTHPIRVYWEDTDAGGVVFYANYLKYFERARTEWLRSLGVSQQAMALEDGAVFIVSDTQVKYRAPARLDDELRVSVQLQHVGGASLTLTQQARRDEQVLAESTVRIGCVDASSFNPRRLPDRVTQCLQRMPPAALPMRAGQGTEPAPAQAIQTLSKSTVA
jgi:acyl-CoA thioester hydrolase